MTILKKQFVLLLAGILSFSVWGADNFSRPEYQLLPVSGEQMLLQPGAERELFFTGNAGLPDRLTYTLLDYGGQETDSGVLDRVPGTNQFTARIKLESGFREMYILETKERFGLVAAETVEQPDPFFGIEAILTLPAVRRQAPEGKDYRADGLAILKRCGWRINREVVFPRSMEKENLAGFINDSQRSGIDTALMLGTWTPEISATKQPLIYPAYPEKIRPILNTEAFRSATFWQILNECDSKPFPGEAILPAVHVGAYEAQRNNRKLLGPAFCAGNTPQLHGALQNGLLELIDVFSFHTYEAPETLVPAISEYRKQLFGYARANLPFWLTECGKSWPRGGNATGSIYGGALGNLRAQIGADRLSAQWITMKAVEAKVCGVGRYIVFALPFFPENRNNFGILDAAWTPHRQLAAYWTVTNKLANRRYIGDWGGKLPRKIRKMRLFASPDNQEITAVLYIGMTSRTRLSLKGIPYISAYAIDGTPLQVNNDEIMFSGGLVYLSMKPEGLSVNTDTDAMRLQKLSQTPVMPKKKVEPIVYQFDAWNVQGLSGSAYIVMDGVLRFRAVNLGTIPQRIAPELAAPDGIVFSEIAGENIVPPGGSVELRWKFDDPKKIGGLLNFVLTDSAFPNIRRVISVFDPNRTAARSMKIDEVSLWTPKSSEQKTEVLSDNGSIVFRENFAGDSRWCFPGLTLPETMVHPAAFSFEMKVDQPNIRKVRDGGVFLKDSKGKNLYYFKLSRDISVGEWKRYYILLSPEQKEKTAEIQIGVCPHTPQVEFRIRDMKLYFFDNTIKVKQ